MPCEVKVIGEDPLRRHYVSRGLSDRREGGPEVVLCLEDSRHSQEASVAGAGSLRTGRSLSWRGQ